MNIDLRELRLNDGLEIFRMIKEIGSGENGYVNSGYDMEFSGFPDYLLKNYNYSKGINLDLEHVPQTIYWLFINKYPVGIGKLRHYLNEALMNHGGHIGYCIRPSERGKGYGTIILKELTVKAKEMGIKELLFTVNENNVYSRKVIERNGGELESVLEGSCKYWIRNL